MKLFGKPSLLWVVGRNVLQPFRGKWSFEGVFSDKQMALSRCTTPEHFLGPVTLDIPLDGETWEGAFFPMADVANTVKHSVRQGIAEAIRGLR